MDHAPFIVDRLRSRRAEVEQALLARVFGIGDPSATEDREYLEGFQTAATAAVDFALAMLGSGTGDEPPVPPIFLLQAKLAARNRVRLDIVLRRYAAAQAVLADFVIGEAEREAAMPAVELRDLLALSSAAFDRVLLGIGDEYVREAAKLLVNSHDRSKVDRVERLLAGEPVPSAYLDYPLEGWHVAVVAEGVDTRKVLAELAREVDRRLLAVEPRPDSVWGWLGGRAPADPGELAKLFRGQPMTEMKLGIGEPGHGVGGWRLSHRQASAVLPLAEGHPVALARYAEMGVRASIQQDQVLVESLRKLYLEPLLPANKGQDVLRETVGAYLAAECSASSAASALKVHRQTVTSRLRAVEERLGKSISDCALELNLALMIGLDGDNSP